MDDEILDLPESESFEFFRNFLNAAEAKAFGDMLESNDIPFLLESSGTVIDAALVGDGLVPKAVIKIKASDFKKVNNIIAAELEQVTYDDLGDHYLTQFDTQELLDIFQQPEEWTAEDIAIAKIILQQRGEELSDAEINTLREDRFTAIRAGTKGSYFWIAMYSLWIATGLFYSLILLLAGFGMAYYYAFGKSTDPDGNRYFLYEEKTRQIGIAMLAGGITLVLIELIFLNFMY